MGLRGLELVFSTPCLGMSSHAGGANHDLNDFNFSFFKLEL